MNHRLAPEYTALGSVHVRLAQSAASDLQGSHPNYHVSTVYLRLKMTDIADAVRTANGEKKIGAP